MTTYPRNGHQGHYPPSSGDINNPNNFTAPWFDPETLIQMTEEVVFQIMSQRVPVTSGEQMTLTGNFVELIFLSLQVVLLL